MNNKEIITIKDLRLTENEINICKKIAENTLNTWQTNRTLEEKISDTCLGKCAEKAIRTFLLTDKNNRNISFYDDFRIDNYKNHNSVDFIFASNKENLLWGQEYLQKNIKNIVKISKEEKIIIKSKKVNICEIKATRINSRHLSQENIINFDKILKDDFLTYPLYTRKSTIQNSEEYINKYKEKNNLTEEQLLKEECNNLLDWYFRIYIKEHITLGKCDAYIVGALRGNEFINNFNIKKMAKGKKSENAIYLSVPLYKGISIVEFEKKYLKSDDCAMANQQQLTIPVRNINFKKSL